MARLFLIQAAEALEAVLLRNDEKADWLPRWGDDVAMHIHQVLMPLLKEELRELELSLSAGEPREVQHEALDVALCALFVWACAGGSTTINRGREVPNA